MYKCTYVSIHTMHTYVCETIRAQLIEYSYRQQEERIARMSNKLYSFRWKISPGSRIREKSVNDSQFWSTAKKIQGKWSPRRRARSIQESIRRWNRAQRVAANRLLITVPLLTVGISQGRSREYKTALFALTSVPATPSTPRFKEKLVPAFVRLLIV